MRAGKIRNEIAFRTILWKLGWLVESGSRVFSESTVLSAHYPATSRGERATCLRRRYTHIVARVHMSIWFQLPNRVGVALCRQFLWCSPSPDARRDQRCVNANFTRSITFSSRIIRYRARRRTPGRA